MKKVNEKVFYQSDTVKRPLTWQKVETTKFENINLAKREKNGAFLPLCSSVSLSWHQATNCINPWKCLLVHTWLQDWEWCQCILNDKCPFACSKWYSREVSATGMDYGREWLRSSNLCSAAPCVKVVEVHVPCLYHFSQIPVKFVLTNLQQWRHPSLSGRQFRASLSFLFSHCKADIFLAWLSLQFLFLLSTDPKSHLSSSSICIPL